MRLDARLVLEDLPITLGKTSERELQKTPEGNQGHTHLDQNASWRRGKRKFFVTTETIPKLDENLRVTYRRTSASPHVHITINVSTILLGNSLESDLCASQLSHPQRTGIDTVMIFHCPPAMFGMTCTQMARPHHTWL